MSTVHQTPFAEMMASREGLTNQKLAVMVGTQESNVSRWRRGLRPGKTFQDKIIRKLKLTEAEVAKLGWTEETANA